MEQKIWKNVRIKLIMKKNNLDIFKFSIIHIDTMTIGQTWNIKNINGIEYIHIKLFLNFKFHDIYSL